MRFHTPISEGRIDEFSKEENKEVWHYVPHEDEGLEEEEKRERQYVTNMVPEFITRLIIHISDAKFQQIRFYRFYSNRTASRPRQRRMSTDRENAKARLFPEWKHMPLSVYGYSPLICDVGLE